MAESESPWNSSQPSMSQCLNTSMKWEFVAGFIHLFHIVVITEERSTSYQTWLTHTSWYLLFNKKPLLVQLLFLFLFYEVIHSFPIKLTAGLVWLSGRKYIFIMSPQPFKEAYYTHSPCTSIILLAKVIEPGNCFSTVRGKKEILYLKRFTMHPWPVPSDSWAFDVKQF